MRLEINGKSEQHDSLRTVGDLLRRYDVPPIRVAVEVNRELVARAEFDQTSLHEGDAVEIVTFVGGG